MKSSLSEISYETIERDSDSAKVIFSCVRRQSFLRTFFAPKTYKISQDVDLVSEEGVWKVCGDIFDLP